MMDTFELSWVLKPEQEEHLTKDCGIAIEKLPKLQQDPGFTFKTYVIEYIDKSVVKLIVNVPKVLGRGLIVDDDYEEMKTKVSGLLVEHFGDQSMFQEHTLKRIDYRLDCQVTNPEHLKLYLKLFAKSKDKYNRMVKKGILGRDGSIKSKFPNSNIHACKSTEIIIYDKEAERRAKKEPIQSWEEGVLRFEVRLKANHLKNKKRAGRVDKLRDYWSVERHKEYIKSHLFTIYYRAPYHTHEKAKSIIYASSKTEKKKRMLVEFLIMVTKGSFNTPSKSLSKSTVRSRLKDLDELGINPNTIPINDAIGFSSLPNLIAQELESL